MRKTYPKIIIAVLLLVLCVSILSSCEEVERDVIVEMIDGLAENEIIVSFPGLGIRPFVINKNIFAIPLGASNTLHLLCVLGAICAIAYAFYRAKCSEKIKPSAFFDIVLWGVLVGIIGGRLLYVLCSLDKYKDFFSALNVWDGGMSLFGALIFGGVAVFFIARSHKIKFLKVADMSASAVMLGQIIGRFDNFVCGEAYGLDLAEGDIFYFARMGIYPHANGDIRKGLNYVHPAFLYEIIWNLIGFLIISLLYRKKKFNGQIFYFYLAWYGFGRTVTELLRVDSLYVGSIKISMVIACLCFVFGVLLLILGSERGKKERAASESYEKVYTRFKTGTPISSKYKENSSDENEEEDENEDN